MEASCREQMLSDDDFKAAFGSTKERPQNVSVSGALCVRVSCDVWQEEFQRLPGWKRTQKKKEMSLF